MSGVSSDTLDAPISAVVDATENPVTHWIVSAFSSVFFYSFGIPMNIRQLVFVVCAFALAAPVSGVAIASVGVVGCVLAALASAVYEFPIVTAARLVNATLIGPYVLAFHAVANVIEWVAGLFPWLVDPYLAGMLTFTALCAVATIMLRCVVKLPHLHSLRTGILQQMFVLATQWLLQLPSWHPIWLAMLPVMHRTGNSDPPPSTTLRVLGARLAIPPAMAAAVGLHARGSKADAASENVATAGASSIWRLVYSACLSLTTALGRGYIIMEAVRYFPWLLPAPARLLLAAPGQASPTPGVQAFTEHRTPAWQLAAADRDGLMPPDAITQDVGSAAYFALQLLSSVVVVPMAAVPGLSALAAACSHRITVLQLALMHPAFASTLNGVARFMLGCAMCAFGAKWARRVTGIRHGWMGVVSVVLLPCLVGVNLAYVYGLSIGESLVVALGTSVLMAYTRMLPQCQGMMRRSPVERAARRLNQHWSKQRLASELSGMVVVAIVVARVVFGCAASFFGAVLVVREWPRALWWMRVTLAGQTLALDAAPRLHALSPVLAGTLVTAVAALSVVWKVVCLQQQHRVRAPQHAKALAALLDWPSGVPLSQEQADDLLDSMTGGDDGSGRLGEAAGSMDLYDIAETWSEGSVDLSIGTLPPARGADEDGGEAEGDVGASATASRQGGRASVWWSDTGSDDVSTALGWWRRQGVAPGVSVEGASEGGSSHGGILSGMSQLFEGVAMGRVAVGGIASGLGALSSAGSDPDPCVAQTGDPAYADSDGGTLHSGDAERETTSRSSGLRHYARQFHTRHGRRGTAADSGEMPDSALDAAAAAADAEAYHQPGDSWRHDHHFPAARGGDDDDDDDDTASVMSAATMAGTSRREARKALRRRRHARSRSTGRSAAGASRQSTAAMPAAQRRARTSVHDETGAPAASEIECDAPSVLHQQMTPSIGPIGAPPSESPWGLGEAAFALGQRSPTPAHSGSSHGLPSSAGAAQGYGYSPWGSQHLTPQLSRGAAAPTSGTQHMRSLPAPQVGVGFGASHRSAASHQAHFSEPTLQAGAGNMHPAHTSRPPRAEAIAGGARTLSIFSGRGGLSGEGTGASGVSIAPDITPAAAGAAGGLLQTSLPQRFAQPSPLPPVTMQSGGAGGALGGALGITGLSRPPHRGGVKRHRVHSADSEALDVDLVAGVSNSQSRSMDSAATAPAGLLNVHTPLPSPVPQPDAAGAEGVPKRPRPLHPPAVPTTASVVGQEHTVQEGRQGAECRPPPPPSVAPPTPPSSVAAAASTSRLSTVPASVAMQLSSSSALSNEAIFQASASVTAAPARTALLSPSPSSDRSSAEGGGASPQRREQPQPSDGSSGAASPSPDSTAHST